MEEYKKNINIKFILPFVVIVSLILAFAVTYFSGKKETKIEKPMDYVISGVPYFSIYNHKNSNSYVGYYSGGDSCAAFASVLTYWKSEQKIDADICKSLQSDSKGLLGGESFISAFNKNGLESKEVVLKISELKKYINSEVKTPLIFFLPISNDQPADVSYSPAKVLIGIKESEKKVIFHDYWLGNNYEMTYEEFNNLAEKMNPAKRNLYIVVQPKNLDEKLKEISSRKTDFYPARTTIMQNAEGMFKDYAIGSGGAYRTNNWSIALDYLLKVKEDPNFEKYFPPYFKVTVFYQLAQIYLNKKDLNNALLYAQKSVDNNFDLNKSFSDWPGYEIRNRKAEIINEIMWPFLSLGDTYFEKGNYDKALVNYKKAYEISLFSETINKKIIDAEKAIAEKKK